jgi:hypothetical protein
MHDKNYIVIEVARFRGSQFIKTAVMNFNKQYTLDDSLGGFRKKVIRGEE